MYHQTSVEAINKVKEACKVLGKDLLVIEVPKEHNPHYSCDINEYELNGKLESDLNFIATENNDYYVYETDKKRFGSLYSLSLNIN